MTRILVFICTILLIINVSEVNAFDYKNEMSSNSSSWVELIESDSVTDNIVIRNNEELTNMASANGWIGSGVGNDPYQIETQISNSSISIINTNLFIVITNQTFNDNTILLYNASNIEISSNNFENTYIEISYSEQISVPNNQMAQTTTANGWQPLIEIDRSRGVSILENFYYGSISRSFFLSSYASTNIDIQDNLMEIIYGADSLFFDFRQSSDLFIQNNTIKSSYSSPIKIRTSNYITLESNNFQSIYLEFWSVNDLTLHYNFINESRIFISDSIIIDFTANEVNGKSLAFWKSARINISDNTFSNSYDAIQLSYSSDYTIENNLFINIENLDVLYNPPKSKTSKLDTYLIVGLVMLNVVFGSLFIRNKFNT